MRARFAALLLAAATALLPLAAHAQATNGFPTAGPFDGSETALGNQDGHTVLIPVTALEAAIGTLFPSTPPAGDCVQTGTSTQLAATSAPCVSLNAVNSWSQPQNFLHGAAFS
jgi:hypothetical protein